MYLDTGYIRSIELRAVQRKGSHITNLKVVVVVEKEFPGTGE